MHTTTRLGLQVPDATDAVSGYPTDANQAFGVLDNAGIYTQGTLTARPAANTVVAGTQYYATDAGILAWSNGTSWISLTPVVRQYHAWTMDDQTSPNPSASLLGSFIISPATDETITIVGAIIHCVTVGSTASTFSVKYDHAAHGTLATVSGLSALTPSATQTLVLATGGPLPLSNLDRIAVAATNASSGNSLGCTIEVVTEHTI